MIHSRTKIIAIVSLCFLLGTIAVYAFFFRVVAQHKENLNNERMSAAQAEAQRKALSNLEALVLSSAESRAKLEQFVLRDDDIIEFLSLIENTAREQGVTITTEGLIVSPQNDLFEKLEASLRIEGSFDGVMRMIRILEVLPQQSSISKMMLSKASVEHSEWQATFVLEVTKFKKHAE
jgi:hypothetical protein